MESICKDYWVKAIFNSREKKLSNTTEHKVKFIVMSVTLVKKVRLLIGAGSIIRYFKKLNVNA